MLLSKDSALLQRPRNKAALSLIYSGIPKFEAEARGSIVGSRIDFGPIRLPLCMRIERLASYPLRDTLTPFARAENLTHARYEEVFNYGFAGRSFHAGVRATW
jgi:vitamin B12 transporter